MARGRKVADLTPEQLKVFKARGARGEEETFTYPFATGVLRHGLAKKLSVEIVRHGMTIVDMRHDGGLIFRHHVIVFRGNAWQGVLVSRALDAHLRMLQEEGA